MRCSVDVMECHKNLQPFNFKMIVPRVGGRGRVHQNSEVWVCVRISGLCEKKNTVAISDCNS